VRVEGGGAVVGQAEDQLGLVAGVHGLAGLQALQLGGLLLPAQQAHRQPGAGRWPLEQPADQLSLQR
jgi:hypothetical protein